jgi:hypothetical protein
MFDAAAELYCCTNQLLDVFQTPQCPAYRSARWKLSSAIGPFPFALAGCSLALGQNDIERKKYVQDMTSLLEH